jgi:hypothetical protein
MLKPQTGSLKTLVRYFDGPPLYNNYDHDNRIDFMKMGVGGQAGIIKELEGYDYCLLEFPDPSLDHKRTGIQIH